MQIVWIASYPKSGNTWLRAFLMNLIWGKAKAPSLADLGTYFASATARQWYDAAYKADTNSLDARALLALRHKAIELMSRDTQGMVFVKTHSPILAFGPGPEHHLIPPDLTRGALYIVRNPLDIVPSAARHYGVSVDQMIDLLASDEFGNIGTQEHVPEKIGSWLSHVNGWIKGADEPSRPEHQVPQILRYEDMYQNPLDTFSKATSYLGIEVPRARMLRALQSSSFEHLRNDEEQHGFAERSSHTDRFFRYGKPGAGKAELSGEQIARIVATQGPMMRRCGYPTDGYGQN